MHHGQAHDGEGGVGRDVGVGRVDEHLLVRRERVPEKCSKEAIS